MKKFLGVLLAVMVYLLGSVALFGMLIIGTDLAGRDRDKKSAETRR